MGRNVDVFSSRSIAVATGLAGALLSAWLGFSRTSFRPDEAVSPPRWNVLLISVDSLRADHLGCYGYARNTSPAIDQLSSEGVLFTSCTAPAPWTHPSHMSMLTSLYPTAHGVLSIDSRMRPGCVTLAQVLQDHGYRTGAVISGGRMRPEQGFGQGFELYDDYSVLRAELVSGLVVSENPLGTTELPTSAQTNEAALAWLKNGDDRPFFLFLHYWDVHWDYAPPPPYDEAFGPEYTGTMTGTKADLDERLFAGCERNDLERVVALYDGEIRWTDLHIGVVLEELKHSGLYEDTLIILAADHGEEFLEHGGHGHGHSLYEELLHVPLVVKLPSSVQVAPLQVSDPVSLVDVMPTVLDVLDIDPPERLDGTSLAPLVKGESWPVPRPVFAEGVVGKSRCMVRVGQRKLIRDPAKGEEEAFDLSVDPLEQHAVQSRGKDVEQLASLLDQWLGSNEIQIEQLGETPEGEQVNERTREALRRLGYVGSNQE